MNDEIRDQLRRETAAAKRPVAAQAIIDAAEDMGLNVETFDHKGLPHWKFSRPGSDDFVEMVIAPTPSRFAITCYIVSAGPDETKTLIPTRDAISAMLDL